MSLLLKSALVLTLIGAINWAIIAIFGENFIVNMFGDSSWLTKTTYIIIGASAIICIGIFFLDLEYPRYRHRHH